MRIEYKANTKRIRDRILDRSTDNGDCFIVTGSIGPDFEPRLFKRHRNALRYAREIARTVSSVPFFPVIENRFQRDMIYMRAE